MEPGGVRTGIVATSDASLPPELEGPAVRVVPLQVIFGAEAFRDGVDITPQAFYERLRCGAAPPSTSIPSPGQYLEAIRAVAGDGVLVLTPERGLTGMYDAAVVAARLYAEEGSARPVHVLDTHNAAVGFGLAVRLAIACARAGLPAKQVRDHVAAALPAVMLAGSPAALTYLARSGRVPGIASQLGDRLGLRAVFELAGGRVRRVRPARGEQGAVHALVRRAVARIGREPVWLLTFHADAPAAGERLHRRLVETLVVARGEVCPAALAVAAHAGPGLIGFAALPERVLSAEC